MHICPNCIAAFLMALPFVGKGIHWAYMKLKRRRLAARTSVGTAGEAG